MTNTTNTATGPVLITPRLSKEGRQFGLDVETLDLQAALIWRSFGEGRREFNKGTRVYGALDAFVPDFSAEETRLQAAITDHDVRDPALAAYQRAAKKEARAGLLSALPVLADALRGAGLRVSAVDGLDAKFSLKAGCSMCACSPGFVLDRTVGVDGHRVDVHLS